MDDGAWPPAQPEHLEDFAPQLARTADAEAQPEEPVESIPSDPPVFKANETDGAETGTFKAAAEGPPSGPTAP